MSPEISTTNLGIALDHPHLIWLFLRGHSATELKRAHFAIHLREIAELKISDDETDPFGFVCQAIDLVSSSEFPLLYLYLVCRYLRPEQIVETGVHVGISSAAILKALHEVGGHLYSIDLPHVNYQADDGRCRGIPLAPDAQTGFFIPEPYKKNWTLIVGDSREELPSLLKSIGTIGVFHHDGMHTYDNMMFEYETVWPYLRYDGFLFAHNVNWNSAFADFCQHHTADYRIRGMVGVARKTKAS